MMCDCIDKVQKKLEEFHGSEVSLDLKQTVDMKTMKFGRALPPLSYSFVKDGKRKKSFIVFPFCPLCGKKGSP